MTVRGLRKEFDTPDGIKKAVDGVDLTMYEGQIFCLLGHNGKRTHEMQLPCNCACELNSVALNVSCRRWQVNNDLDAYRYGSFTILLVLCGSRFFVSLSNVFLRACLLDCCGYVSIFYLYA